MTQNNILARQKEKITTLVVRVTGTGQRKSTQKSISTQICSYISDFL